MRDSTKDNIHRAVELLRQGRLVAFPTETVYGLGADATNSQAVGRIFAVKGRPGTNPLIVHVADIETARRYTDDWPPAAQKLVSRFWPGPLTLVVSKAQQIVPEVSAGRATVGLRAPNHPLALELLRAFDGPIAAPSANRSNRVSPTTAEHVRSEFGAAVDLILDGGSCNVGIESTVLDLTSSRPTILRPGAVTAEQIQSIIGKVQISIGNLDGSRSAKSPGQHRLHYCPATPAYRFEQTQAKFLAERLASDPQAEAVILLDAATPQSAFLQASHSSVQILKMPADPEQYARELYATLRSVDALGVQAIFIELPPPSPLWDAVRDRLTRATNPL